MYCLLSMQVPLWVSWGWHQMYNVPVHHEFFKPFRYKIMCIVSDQLVWWSDIPKYRLTSFNYCGWLQVGKLMFKDTDTYSPLQPNVVDPWFQQHEIHKSHLGCLPVLRILACLQAYLGFVCIHHIVDILLWCHCWHFWLHNSQMRFLNFLKKFTFQSYGYDSAIHCNDTIHYV